MPHTTRVLVIHPNGNTFTSRNRAQGLVESGRAYWRDLAKSVLVIISSTDDEESNGYEYGGKQSYDRRATETRVDPRNGTPFEAAKESIDRTAIPVREAGGAKVMQLKPLRDRRTGGTHAPRPDRLWHPAQKNKGGYRQGF